MTMTMQGAELKALRKAAGLNQATVADDLGLSGTFIGLMERDAKPIERRTELAARLLYDRYDVEKLVSEDRYAVVRRTLDDVPRGGALASYHGRTILYGLFKRRDHAYRWAAALKGAPKPRWSRTVDRLPALTALAGSQPTAR